MNTFKFLRRGRSTLDIAASATKARNEIGLELNIMRAENAALRDENAKLRIAKDEAEEAYSAGKVREISDKIYCQFERIRELEGIIGLQAEKIDKLERLGALREKLAGKLSAECARLREIAEELSPDAIAHRCHKAKRREIAKRQRDRRKAVQSLRSVA